MKLLHKVGAWIRIYYWGLVLSFSTKDIVKMQYAIKKQTDAMNDYYKF